MNHKIKLLISLAVIVVCTAVVAPRVQALLNQINTTNGQMINPRPGPEADPTLRHCPGCIDYDANSLPSAVDTQP